MVAFSTRSSEEKRFSVIVPVRRLPLFAAMLPAMKTVEHVVVNGDGDRSLLGGFIGQVHDYAELIANEPDSYPWPDIDERQAAALVLVFLDLHGPSKSKDRLAAGVARRQAAAHVFLGQQVQVRFHFTFTNPSGLPDTSWKPVGPR